ncbi:MAG: methyltransferase domain-containing protein [Bacteroidales bacterium]|nr:methyltransferase domain-containing protein [Bacteroidales bacterium]
MIADRIKWNKRHGERNGFNPADTYLMKKLDFLKPSRVLDLACGRGRNAFFLAENGFHVTAADISDTGLKILYEEALKRSLSIQTIEADLDEAEPLLSLERFDSIICINFKPTEAFLKFIPELLSENGTFLWCSFNEKQVELTGFSAVKALHPEEFCNFFGEMKLVDYSRFIDESGFRDAYFFVKE